MLEPREPRQDSDRALNTPVPTGRKRMSAKVAARLRDKGETSFESAHLSELLTAMQAVKDGDFNVKLPTDWTGLHGKIADTFNELVFSNRRMAEELERVGDAVGKKGKTRQRAFWGPRAGAWGRMEHTVNTLIDDLLWPTEQ